MSTRRSIRAFRRSLTTMTTLEQIRLKPSEEFGAVLLGRPQAVALRERVANEVANGRTVVLDFEGVATMSPSFAHEFFGRLPVELLESHQVIVEQLPEELESLARFVRIGRNGTD